MEDVLAVYTRPRDPECPLVCLDESSKQLLAETRVPVPMKPGRPARHDYEYERNGTAAHNSPNIVTLEHARNLVAYGVAEWVGEPPPADPHD
jgi:hypothetical protein